MGKSTFYGYKVAFGTFIIMLTHLGFLGCIGVFLPHVAQGLNASLGEVSLVVTTATGGAFVCSLFASRVITKLTARWALFLSTILCSLHYVLFGFTNSAFIYVAGGAIAGIVMGLGTNVAAASIISQWFIDKRSTVIGLVFGGAGFGASIAMFLSAQLIESFGWRNAYFILAAVIFVLGALPNFLLIRTPEEKGQKPLGWEKQEELAQGPKEEAGLTLEEARKTKTFMFWWIGILLVSMFASGFASFGPAYLQEFGISHLQAANTISFTNLLGAVLIMASGAFAEKFGIRFYISYVLIAFIIGTSVLVTFPNTNFLFTGIYIIGIALAGPASNSFIPTITPVGFGARDYTRIVAQLASANYLSKAIIPIIMGQVDRFTNSLRAGFVLEIVFAVIGLVLLLAGLRLAPNLKRKKTGEMPEEGLKDV